ncbi:hypothetical protein RF55_13672, partial [Lasius niger]
MDIGVKLEDTRIYDKGRDRKRDDEGEGWEKGMEFRKEIGGRQRKRNSKEMLGRDEG